MECSLLPRGRWRSSHFLDKGYRCIDGESQRGAACDIERQVGADVDPGQAHSGNGAQDEGTADGAKVWQGGGAEGGGDTGMPRQVSQAGGVRAAEAGAREQEHRPGSAHHLLDKAASWRSPASQAAPAATGAAPRVPSCMVTQAGG